MSNGQGMTRLILNQKFIRDCCELSGITHQDFWYNNNISNLQRVEVLRKLYSSIDLLPAPADLGLGSSKWWYISEVDYTHFLLRYS